MAPQRTECAIFFWMPELRKQESASVRLLTVRQAVLREFVSHKEGSEGTAVPADEQQLFTRTTGSPSAVPVAQQRQE